MLAVEEEEEREKEKEVKVKWEKIRIIRKEENR